MTVSYSYKIRDVYYLDNDGLENQLNAYCKGCLNMRVFSIEHRSPERGEGGTLWKKCVVTFERQLEWTEV